MFRQMRPLVLVLVCVSAAAVAGLSVSAIGKPAKERLGPPASPVIAMVNLPKVLDGLKERAVKDKDLDKGKQDLQKKADDAKKALDSDRQALDLMPNNDAKITAAKAYREKLLRTDFDLDFGKQLLAEQQAEGLKELYSKITIASAALAKARGYQLVISNDDGVQVRGNTEEATRTISLKRFLYVDPSMDITDELVQYMNNEYETGSKK